MSSEYIGFRANYRTDADIVDALANAKNRTKEIKRLIRLGLQASQLPAAPTVMKAPKAIDWRPTFTDQAPPASIARNILSGFE